jgi:hypothetical protein
LPLLPHAVANKLAATRSATLRRRGPAALAQRPRPLGHPPGGVELSAQQHLDVGIEAAELIGRPPGQRIMDRGINPE